MSVELELQSLAVAIAREAGDFAAALRLDGVEVADTKSTAADIVTEADRAVEALIRARLGEARPRDGFLGEESGAGVGTSGITWIVDPIDGTVNYANGFAQYSVSIAAVSGSVVPREWELLAGAVYAPMLGEMFHAARGSGAYLGPSRLAVSTETDAGALVGTGFGYDKATHSGDLAVLGRVMPCARDIRRMGSAALDLAAVAAGRLDAYYERGLKPWDAAAGVLLVQESGGRVLVVEADGERALYVASNPDFFDRITAAVLA